MFQKDKKINEDKVQCCICPHYCILSNYQIGKCLSRVNVEGIISPISYSHISNMAVEPIEKKPFLHILKGTKTLSIGSWGCNLNCNFCESTCISQKKPNLIKIVNAYEIPDIVKKYSCQSVCLTYNEPIISIEYLIDVINQCNREGIKVLLKTNAYVNKDIWDYIINNVYAVNIDFKGDRDSFKEVTGAKEYVLEDRIKEAIFSTCHVEISIPLYYKNISEMQASLEKLAFILYEFKKDVPCHLLKINPAYKFIKRNTTSDEMINWAENLLNRCGSKYVQVFCS